MWDPAVVARERAGSSAEAGAGRALGRRHPRQALWEAPQPGLCPGLSAAAAPLMSASRRPRGGHVRDGRGVAGAEGAPRERDEGLAEGSARHRAFTLGRRGWRSGLGGPGSLPRSPLCRVTEGLLHVPFPPSPHRRAARLTVSPDLALRVPDAASPNPAAR